MSTDPRSRDDVQAEQIRALLVGQEHLAQQMTEIVLAHQHIVRRHDEDVVRVERIERTIAETASSLTAAEFNSAGQFTGKRYVRKQRGCSARGYR